ncbi:PREDICTED: SH3 domain-binding protein 5 homolog [Nicrophorus vespilloides]|uniref:SH3 domain-binding protein 5 homolog n=1 Tax=Nicrophorus vespilloides TaxID=110193 RepID=A0ABM1MM05_NICVS|nr:PREDICTED: SH3 domain-binding protein 5 homolog [Nicrophorus vespilloides]
MDSDPEDELDPRIQVELENLNKSTDEINKLEIELDEANTTFRMLLNEATRRLKLYSKKLGSCIEKARPYYEALEVARKAQTECQKAAVVFRRANEIHAAAKETVALAEQRFMSNQHEWQFDNAWQEMLNHATMKVMDAENEKAESGREHQRTATLFNAAEHKVQELEDRLRRHIIKSRPYFDEKGLCQEQLNTQKDRIEWLKSEISKSKTSYAQSLKNLEQISNEIHMKRNGYNDLLAKPREPGVGAELADEDGVSVASSSATKHGQLPDIERELDKCELRSIGSYSGTTSSAVSEKDDAEEIEEYLDELKLKVKTLAVRPIDGGEGESSDHVWESELRSTVDKLDHMMLLKECADDLNHFKMVNNNTTESK